MTIGHDEKYLIKLKGAGFSDLAIATKLGITEKEVIERWKKLEAGLASMTSSGYSAFCDTVTIAAHQYQLLGESFKIIASALGDRMTEEEIAALIVDDKKQTLENLRSRCIILRPFVPVTPEESLKNTLQGN